MIHEFKGKYHWLSNFTFVEIQLDGTVYPSVEHAYMSAKNNSKKWKGTCSDPYISAGQIKKLSKKVKLIKDWDAKKLEVMQICLTQKFKQKPFKNLLKKTGIQNIQEGNYWNDTFWGICLKTDRGENHLGRLIMKVRDSLK